MPTSLPPLVSDILAAALELDSGRIQLIWSAFSDLAEAAHNTSAQPYLDDIFRVVPMNQKRKLMPGTATGYCSEPVVDWVPDLSLGRFSGLVNDSCAHISISSLPGIEFSAWNLSVSSTVIPKACSSACRISVSIQNWGGTSGGH
jgi:hypothetical protein